MQIGVTNGGGGALAVCKLDDEKEGRREGRREGRKEGKRWRGRGGEGADLSCTGMNMTQRQQPEPLLLFSPLQPHPSMPTKRREERGREGTVSMATAEQR